MKRLIALALSSLFLSSHLLAQPAANQPDLMGEIEIDTAEEADKTSYPVVQKNVIQFFRHMDSQVASLSTGGAAHIPLLAEAEYQYLTAAYLYCTVQQGVCQQFLDALFEADLIAAKLGKKDECPVLTNFWKIWLKNDMERRQQYLVKTAFLNDTERFRQNERNGYINCKPSIARESATQPENQFFSSRYKDPSKAAVFRRIALMLDGIKSKVPNLYQALGIKLTNKAGSVPEGGKKKRK